MLAFGSLIIKIWLHLYCQLHQTTPMKRTQSFIAFLIDATAAFFIYQIVALALAYFYFLPLFPSFFVVWLLYYLCSFLFQTTTLGLSFFNGCLKDNGNPRSHILRVILREGFTSFPAVVLWLFAWSSIVPLLTALMGVICVTFTIWRKKLFKFTTVLTDQPISRSKILVLYTLLILLGVGSFSLNTYLTGDKIIFAEKPIAIRPRPSAHSVSQYTRFIKDNRKDINEYIRQLFQYYDHVVLCERWHPESTQYDMIYDLVSTPYFADSIGNLFTEIGNVKKREDFRTLTSTSFPSDSAREKALASFIVDSQTVWLIWSNTNWFNFLKRMSQFNHLRSHPVNVLFADILWTDYDKLADRDSIMAANIINTIHSDSIQKSLVIMNYRHAFMIGRNCGAYLQKAFPGKVANVLINTFRPNICQIPSAIQQGRWDVAAEQSGYDRFALDFRNSPFGDDSFDLYPVMSLTTPKNMKYEDMFTGMIYCTVPAQQYAGHGFPYLFSPENQAKLQSAVSVMPGDRLANYEYLKYGNLIEKGGNYLENFVYNFLYLILFFLSLTLLIAMSISTIRHHKKTNS